MTNKVYKNNTKQLIAIFVLCFLFQFSFAQSVARLNIDTCIALAEKNYPLAKQSGFLQAVGANNLKGINGAWLPQIGFDAKGTYQSEVTSFDFPGFSPLPKYSYEAALKLNQTMFDGNVTAQQRETDKANTETEIQKVQVETYKIRERIVQMYGNVLLAKENLKVLDSYMEDIQSKKSRLKSLVANGALLQSNVDVLDAETLKTEQKVIELNANLKTLYQILSLYIGQQVDENTLFEEIPTTSATASATTNRPEWKLFDLQQNLINEKVKVLKFKTLPKLSAFASGSYGLPGYNFLATNPHVYALVGGILNWNIGSVYNLIYERKGLNLSRNFIDVQKEMFELNQKISTTQQNGEVEKMNLMIAKDNEIITKRKSITKTSADQLDNGTITSSDYLTELNAEKQAVLNQRIHQLQLGIAYMNIKVITGN